MNDPTDPTNPHPADPVESRVRDALAARAGSVEPGLGDPSALQAAIAADDRARRRLTGAIAGLAAAALLLVVALVAVPDRSSDVDSVRTADDAGATTTSAPEPTTPTTDGTPTSGVPTTSVPPTTVTTLAPTTTPPTTVPPTTAATRPPAALPGADTGPKAGGRQGDVVAVMTDLRVGRNEGFDRIVLEFRGTAIPEWSVAYVEPPITEDATGEPVTVGGGAYLQIRLDGAQGHDPETAEPVYRGSRRVPGGGSNQVVEVVNTGGFEATYTWVAGLRDRVPFRVQVLTGPSRLVIDVAHAA